MSSIDDSPDPVGYDKAAADRYFAAEAEKKRREEEKKQNEQQKQNDWPKTQAWKTWTAVPKENERQERKK